MSRTTTHTSSPLSKVLFQFCERMVRRSAVLWPGLNPNCLFDIKLFWNRCFCSCLFTTDSITLLIMQSNEIGRYFDGSALDSLLWIGMTEAIFHWLGNTPWEKQRRKRRQRGLASSALHSLRTLPGMWSGPVALSGASCFSKRLMILGLKMTFSIVEAVGWLSECGGGESAFERLHFSANVLQNLLAFSLAVIWAPSSSTMTGI